MTELNPQNWTPISEPELRKLIELAEAGMDDALQKFWERIRVRPVKWALPTIGDLGGGFWVVAVIGQKCIWFNDIEDGFNVSRFEVFGTISEYWCNQSELGSVIRWYFEDFRTAIQ